MRDKPLQTSYHIPTQKTTKVSKMEDNTLWEHKHTFNTSGKYLPWSEEGMLTMEKMLLCMTPGEQKDFGRYTMTYAHLGIMPDVYWNQEDGIVEIVTQGKRYFKYAWLVLYLTEGHQLHINTEE